MFVAVCDCCGQDSELLLPELLAGAGYTTMLAGTDHSNTVHLVLCCGGKWHLGHRPQYLPLRHGFHRWLGAPNCHFQYGVKWRPGPNIPVYEDGEMVGRYYEGDFGIDIKSGRSNFTKRLTEAVTQFMQVRRGWSMFCLVISGPPLQRDDTSNPYFLYFAPDSTHAPAYSSADWAGSSVRATHYGAAVRELDWAVGRVLSAAAGNSRNTLVIFTSDNGAALISREQAGSSGPLLCGKQTTFEVVFSCTFSH